MTREEYESYEKQNDALKQRIKKMEELRSEAVATGRNFTNEELKSYRALIDEALRVTPMAVLIWREKRGILV